MLLLFFRHVFVTIQPDLVIPFLVEPIGCWASTVARLQEARRHSQGLAELELPFYVVGGLSAAAESLMAQDVGVTIGAESGILARPVSMKMLAFLTTSWWDPRQTLADSTLRQRCRRTAQEECDLTFAWGEYSGFYRLSSKVILPSRRFIKERIDMAVFPALQGGPHNHQIEALNTPEFVEYSKAVVSNAGTLAEALIAKEAQARQWRN